MDILSFYTIKLGHFNVISNFYYVTKQESLTAKIGKTRKTSFGGIDSSM
jgi:hypothetical protein